MVAGSMVHQNALSYGKVSGFSILGAAEIVSNP